MLGSHYWQRQGRTEMEPAKFAEYLRGMRTKEEIFWMVSDSDRITSSLDDAVAAVEATTDVAAKEYVDPFKWRERWRAFVAFKPGRPA